MSSQTDALWNEFAAETEEHLDAIERLLSSRRGGEWTREEVAALFRYFHSLKGTFLAMDFRNVEALAHRCEDVLSLVRDGRAKLDREVTKLLLRSVDRLKDMREEVIAKRKDAKPATDILKELDHHHGTPPDPEGQAIEKPVDLPFSDDPEMLAIFSELMEQRLPDVAPALSRNAEDGAAAVATAQELAYSAEMMGFEALAQSLRQIGETGAQDDARRDRIERFGDIREQAKIIEEATGVASGAAPLAAALASLFSPDYADRYHAFASVLSGFDYDGGQSDAVVGASQALRAVAHCLGLDRGARLLLFVEERFRNLGHLESTRLAFLRELAGDTLEALRQVPDGLRDVDPDLADALASKWEATFQAEPRDGEAHGGQTLRPELIATLSAEQRQRMESALAEGRRAYEIVLDLEANRDVADDIIAWLSSAVETITSRTAYRNGINCFEFLIFSGHPPDWVRAQLLALDPEQACLRGIDGHVPEWSMALESTADPARAGTGPARAPLIRVRSETIDELMAEVGEMRTALASLADIVQHGRIASVIREARRYGRSQTQAPELGTHLDAIEDDLRDLRSVEHTLEAAHRRIWAAGLELRVIPIDGLFSRLSRAARDLADKLGKDIDVAIEGREVHIDKSMVDLLIDPLMHMVRNAIDHGIEASERRRAEGKPPRATLAISAFEHSNRINIMVADDGQGLDRAKIAAKAAGLGFVAPREAEQMSDQEITALIFRPGFSTADSITEISGRGVGLDVVAAAVQRLGGAIDVETRLGAGTKFTLKMPVSAALLRALLVEVGEQIFALPERQVVNVLELSADKIDDIAGQRVVIYQGAAVPLHWLAGVLGFEQDNGRGRTDVIIVSVGARMLGLAVDRVLRFRDLFLKELHPMLATVPFIAGASVLGDGRPVLVLDASGLIGLGQAEAQQGVAQP